MSSDADLLFYGCDLAATADGQELMNQIGAAWTVVVAASADLTGHADLGGDCDLQYQTGEVETYVARFVTGQHCYEHVWYAARGCGRTSRVAQFYLDLSLSGTYFDSSFVTSSTHHRPRQ